MKFALGFGLSAAVVAVCVLLAIEPFPGADAQFGFGENRFFRNFQRGASNVFRPMFFRRPQTTAFSPQPTTSQFSGRPASSSSGFRDSSAPSSNGITGNTGGTEKPAATGNDEILPDSSSKFFFDCGRDPKKGNRLLCVPDGKLCSERVNKPGIQRFGNHNYWFSWKDPVLANQNWDWLNARNYCRKRCMDLVSFETEQEYNWVKGFMNRYLDSFIIGVKYIWTSGRLCNFDGCDRPDLEPKNINGWFWSANQARLAPSNSRNQFHDWSQTGGFRPPRPQPDNLEQTLKNGREEACLAVLNNFYGDGIKWHDVACHHEMPIVCEDVEGHLAFARITFPNIQIP